MQTIEQKAQLIAADMKDNNNVEHEFAFDPFMIITIIGIIVDVVRIYKACNQTASKAANSMKNADLLARWRLKKVIKKHIDDQEMEDFLGKRMFKSILNVSSSLTDDEVQLMYDEVN